MWSRVEVHAADTPLPELGMVGRSKQPEAVSGHLPQHEHSMYEIVYFVTGQVQWWAADETHQVHAGEVYVTRPHEPHGAVDESLEPCDIFWLQVDLESPEPLGLSPDESTALRRVLAGSTRLARPEAVIKHHFERLLTECLHGASRRSYARAHTIAILDLTANALELDRNPSEHPAQLDAATLWMRANMHRSVRVQECADAIGVTAGQLFALFKHELGTTPNEWLTRQRIDDARRRLDNGETITTTAHDLGFASSQYFATVFKRYTGHTPSEYRTRTSPRSA
jgi:AraC family L-rhamnose operon regulatory protein RhaS